MDVNLCLACSYSGPGLLRFPKEKNKVIQWLKSLNREDLLKTEDESTIQKKRKICKSHFADWCFAGKEKKRLKKNAVPNQLSPQSVPNLDKLRTPASNLHDITKLEDTDQKKSSDSISSAIKESAKEHTFNRLNSEEIGNKEIVLNEQMQEIEMNKERNVKKTESADKYELDWKECNKLNKMEPDRIIGATRVPGKILLLVKWKGIDEADLVPSAIANWKFPQKVIEYYESRLKWTGEEDTKNIVTSKKDEDKDNTPLKMNSEENKENIEFKNQMK